jgi:hypothetical protein
MFSRHIKAKNRLGIKEESLMAELFDKVKQGVEKGISSVGIKSKEVIESRKINKQIDTIQEQIKTEITELGHLVYTMSVQNNFEQEPVSQKCAAISGLYDQIKAREEELQQLHLETGEAFGKIYCRKCRAELAESFKFCSQCGESLEEQALNPS